MEIQGPVQYSGVFADNTIVGSSNTPSPGSHWSVTNNIHASHAPAWSGGADAAATTPEITVEAVLPSTPPASAPAAAPVVAAPPAPVPVYDQMSTLLTDAERSAASAAIA